MVDVSETSAVPIVVLARQQDHVEYLNSTLRKAGHAVHCHWIDELNDLAETLTQVNCHLLIAVHGNTSQELPTILTAFQQLAPRVPALVVRQQVDELTIAEVMQLGARDLVSFSHPQRLQAVVSRELKHFRTEYKLAQTINIAHEYREQLKQLMSGSDDAIVHVQEGIVVDPNPAWLKLLGFPDADAINGQPLMDQFDTDSHAPLKGALVACLQGKWPGHTLKVNALQANGAPLALELHLHAIELDGELAVQMRVPAMRADTRDLNEQIADALARDVSTDLLQRRFFIDELRRLLAQPLKGGVRELVCVQPEGFAQITQALGATRIESFVEQFAGIVKEHLQDKDLAGRFGDCQIYTLLERGTHGDIDAWAASVTRKLAAHVFQIGERQQRCQGVIGRSPVPSMDVDLDQLLESAANPIPPPTVTTTATLAKPPPGDGKRTDAEVAAMTPSAVAPTRIEEDTREHANDRLWARLIKTALMENRFRLLQQPIVTMSGEAQGMHDVLVRMLDELGQEIVPSEFLAAAERHDLMKNIDRWVIGAAMSFCSSRKIQQLFVRLSKDSVLDRSLPLWLGNQLKATRVAAQRMVFEVSEHIASEHIEATQLLVKVLHQTGFKFALEHSGTHNNPVLLLSQLPVDYVKLDGSLMQGLAVDMAVQDRLQQMVSAAKERNIKTIAERVEDANTMAVLWQMGVDYLQGYFVNEPEQVTLG